MGTTADVYGATWLVRGVSRRQRTGANDLVHGDTRGMNGRRTIESSPGAVPISDLASPSLGGDRRPHLA